MVTRTPVSATQPTTLGSGRFSYELVSPWGQLSSGWDLVEVAGIATDSTGRVFVFNRGAHPVIVFDRDGKFIT